MSQWPGLEKNDFVSSKDDASLFIQHVMKLGQKAAFAFRDANRGGKEDVYQVKEKVSACGSCYQQLHCYSLYYYKFRL